MTQPPLLYVPSNPEDEPTSVFRRFVNDRYTLNLANYQDLWAWSTQDIARFWDSVWDFTRVVGDKGPSASEQEPCVQQDTAPSDNPDWFKNATLNWAENMLRDRSERTALIQATEPHPDDPNPPIRRMSYATLYKETITATSALRALGVKPGDRVASYSSHCIENIVAALATSALGAIWTSAASDFGPDGVLERFEQVRPVVIFSVDIVSYNGKLHNHTSKLEELLRGLAAKNLSPKAVVVIPFNLDSSSTTFPPPTRSSAFTATQSPITLSWSAFLQGGTINPIPSTAKLIVDENTPKDGSEFYRAPFNHPLWILFSSGTTGKPKAIVHRAGGMLLQSKKEFDICAGLKKDDVFLYYTTTGWMMWNYLIAGLSSGCTLVLYDGSPLRDPSILWRFVDELGITIFGTSAKYLEQLAKKYEPRKHHKLSTLRHIYSTGSPLAPQSFDYVYSSISPHSSPDHPNQILLSSITGGTDICSLFAGINSTLPVYRGEIQCRMLGMAIQAFDEKGEEVKKNEQGELVCVKPFPCQPLGFWPLEGYGSEEDVKKGEERYKDAYFSGFKGVWYHGDHVVITESRLNNGGGVIMLGRSDGVLNPGGVRFGSAEIYEVLDACFSEGTPNLPPEMTIVDSLCVGQRVDSDERVLLFVKLLPGVKLSDELIKSIAKEIRSRRSARHVPAKCIQVDDVPHTLNGKKVEVPVRKILNGAPLSSINAATLRNPECLQAYIELAARLGADSARL